ncbi:TolC family protein [Pseudomonas aeruginosa]|nr:TolC family protein [Pseudomonas aeruginosa]
MNNRLLEATEPGQPGGLGESPRRPVHAVPRQASTPRGEPDLWGRVGRSVEAARAEIGMAAAALDDTLLSISSEVARSYIEVRTAQRQIRLLEEDIRMLEERLRLVRVRAGEGLTDELYVERQKAELEALRGRLPAWQASETEATNRIAVLLGERPGALARALEAKPGNVLERALPDFQARRALRAGPAET